MKLMVKISLFTFLLIFSSQTIYSCTCEAPGQRNTFRKSKTVFIDKAVEIKESNNKAVADAIGMNKVYDIKFEVEKSWKGKKVKETTVVSDNGHLACDGYPFEIGKRYLV